MSMNKTLLIIFLLTSTIGISLVVIAQELERTGNTEVRKLSTNNDIKYVPFQQEKLELEVSTHVQDMLYPTFGNRYTLILRRGILNRREGDNFTLYKNYYDPNVSYKDRLKLESFTLKFLRNATFKVQGILSKYIEYHDALSKK